ncbi:MAG: hypothetical protein IKW80_03175, partial [Thermoguttaceae bacterium]|nr:hypothetical protein [Thermoguttaceae bacterium]
MNGGGLIDISDGTLTFKGRTRIGYDSAGTINQTGGTVTLSTFTGDDQCLRIGYYASAVGELNISGGTFTTPIESRIGDSGTGTINLTGGELILNSGANMGYETSGKGYMNVNGGTLTYTVNDLRVGRKGYGELNLTSGTVNLGEKLLYVGYYEGSEGVFTMTGGTLTANGLDLGEKVATETAPGAKGTATFNNIYQSFAGDVNVGSYGTGTLTLNATTMNNDGAFYVANHTGATGEVILNSGSSITTAGDINVGRSGAGTLTADNASIGSTEGYLYVGTNASGDGEVTLTNNSTLSVPNHSSRIGQTGPGVLNIQSGSSFSGIGFFLGYDATGDGTVNVDNGRVVASNSIIVGNAGTGMYNSSNGGYTELETGTFYIGGNEDTTNKPAGTGTATFSNSTLKVAGDIIAGNYGTGTLTVDNSTVTGAGKLYIANHVGSTGTVNLNSGTDISIAGNIVVAKSGTGTLNMDGVTITLAANCYLCVGGEVDNTSSSGIGILNMTNGARINNSTHSMRIGQGGTGTVNVLSNSLIESPAFDIHIAYNDTANGTLNIDGGTVNLQSAMIGYSGTGKVEVKNGGTLTGTNELRVGNSGKGTLNIDGGTASFTGLSNVAYAAGSEGKVSIKNGSLTLTNAGATFRIGRYGTGEVEVLEGGQLIVENNTTQLGYYAGSDGTLTIDGGYAKLKRLEIGYAADSTGTFEMKGGKLDILAVDGGHEINVGYSGTGTATVSGGEINATSLRVGRANGSKGTLTIEGDGVMNLSSAARVSHESGSEGTVYVKDNGQLNVTKELSIGYNSKGQVEVSGGQVNANPIVIYDNGSTLKMTGGMVTTPTITIPQVDSLDWSGGGLDVETVNGDLIQKGGVLYPGVSTIATANILGNYTQSSAGKVVIDFDPSNIDWDKITVSGDLDLNGTVFVNFAQDEEPTSTYQIFNAGGNLDVSDVSLDFPDWYSYARWWRLNSNGELVFADPGPGPGPGP